MKYNDTEYLVDRFLDDMIRLSFVYVKNKEDAEDIAQQVFITYLQKKPVFENETHAKNWLCRVTVNKSRNFARNVHTNVDFESLENVLFTADTEEKTKDDEQERVLRAVLSLKQEYKEVIHLYYYMDYNTDEIAKLLGTFPSTVRSRLARARSALEKILKGGNKNDR